MAEKIVIIGAGVAGISAALSLAIKNKQVILVSQMPSWRAQSVMAEGGINGALNTMGEDDTPELHAEETIRAGRGLASHKMVQEMTKAAPRLIEELYENGMSLNLTDDKQIALRSFGGQTKKRTAFASSSTGKQMMHTLMTMLRKYEINGTVECLNNWHFLRANIVNQNLEGCYIYNRENKKMKFLPCKQMIIASGGMNGLFGNTTGSVLNTGAVTASLFTDGVKIANGEMLQYHPTTVRLANKNMLISEATRGEGGRLFVIREGKPYFFMEEKFPTLGNLMPRDVIASEEYNLIKQGYQIYLDLTTLNKEAYKKLDGVISGCTDFLHLDVQKEPIPVEPGIHYFMGGILIDYHHRTNVRGLYAAGECACAYHGANRLGGNSLLGALYGGRVAADTVLSEYDFLNPVLEKDIQREEWNCEGQNTFHLAESKIQLRRIMKESLGILRDEKAMEIGISKINEIIERTENCVDKNAALDENLHWRSECILGLALIKSALARKESRGAHNRTDYPNEDKNYEKLTVAEYLDKNVCISLQNPEVYHAY